MYSQWIITQLTLFFKWWEERWKSKIRSPPASLLFKDHATNQATLKWSIIVIQWEANKRLSILTLNHAYDGYCAGLEKTTIRLTGKRRFYAWASNFLQPLAHQISSHSFNEMKQKVSILNDSKFCEVGQVKHLCLAKQLMKFPWLLGKLKF